MHIQTQQTQESSAPCPFPPPGAAQPTAPKPSPPEDDDMVIDIGTSFWDMTESEMQALDLHDSDLCRVRDEETGWPAEHRSPALSPILWFVPRNYLDAPRGCLPEDPFSAEGEYLISPYTSPDASAPADLPIRSTTMTDASATPLVTALPSCLSDGQGDADAGSQSASPLYMENAKVRLDYIDGALRAEQYDTCSSTGEREFWDVSRLAMTERTQSDRHWREYMEEGTCGYTREQGR